MAREQGRQPKRKALVAEQAGGEVDGNAEGLAAPVHFGGRGDRFLEHEIGQLGDAVVLLGGGDEFGCGDWALFGVGPAGEGLGPNDPPGREVELGLVGNPHLALVDGRVELAQHRQPPRRVGEALRVVIFPFQAVVRGLVGGDQGAGQAARQRAAASDLDPEADRQVERQRADPGGGPKQRRQSVEMIAECLLGIHRTRRKCRHRLDRPCGWVAPTLIRETICSTR